MAAKEHHKNQNPECWWMYKKQCANINIFFHFGTIAFKSATREVCVSLIWLSCECKCPVLHSYKIDAVVPKTFQHENVSFGLKDSGSSFQNSIAETGTADVLWKTNVKCWFVEISDKWERRHQELSRGFWPKWETALPRMFRPSPWMKRVPVFRVSAPEFECEAAVSHALHWPSGCLVLSYISNCLI